MTEALTVQLQALCSCESQRFHAGKFPARLRTVAEEQFLPQLGPYRPYQYIYIYIIYLWGHITIGQQPVKSSYDTTMKYFTWTGSSGGATPEEELVEPEAVARRSCSESGSLSFQQS